MKDLIGTSVLRRVRTTPSFLLGLVLLLAFALRVYRLDAQAIWWDESLSLYRATRDLATVLANTIVIQNAVTHDTLPPLYFVLLHGFVGLLGTSEFALRFFSLVANVATIPLLYVLGRRWFSKRVGLMAAFFGALSPFYVWYAQEARPYALMLFESLLALYALSRVMQMRRGLVRMNADIRGILRGHLRLSAPLTSSLLAWRWVLVYLLAATVSLYTHYYAIFLLPFHFVLIAVFLWPLQRRWTKIWLALPIVPVFFSVFLIPFIRASVAGNAGSGPGPVPFDVMVRDLLNSFSVGITIDLADAIWIDVALGVLLLIGFWAARRSWRAMVLLIAYLAVPVLGLEAASVYRPLYQNSRYFIALSPAFFIGIALGTDALARRARLFGLTACAVFVIGAGLSLVNLYFDPHYGKDDHRAWAQYLQGQSKPGDFVILDSPHTEALYQYYAHNSLPWMSLPLLNRDGEADSPDADLAAVQEALRQYRRVWFLEMNVPFDDPAARIENILYEQAVPLEQVYFAGTSTEISLSLFAATLPTVEPSQIAHPLDVALGSNLWLRGYEAPPSIESGGQGTVQLYWQVDERVGEDYGISLRLVSSDQVQAGIHWGESEAIPIGNRAGTSTWPPQQIVVDTRELPVDVGTRPGQYRLQVEAYHPSTGAVIGNAVLPGEVEVVRPQVPIDPKRVPARQLNQNIGGLRLIGSDWPKGAPLPGDLVPVTFYFQVLNPPQAEVRLEIQLAQRPLLLFGRATTHTETRIAIPCRDLQTGDIIRQTVSLRVPADMSGETELSAILADGQSLRLGDLQVQSISRETRVPTITRPFAARIGDAAVLLGYDLDPASVKPGQTLRLTLYWRAQNSLDASYKVFTHLIDGHDQVIGQQDSIPAGGDRPTTSWLPGEVITDPYLIDVPAGISPGKYWIEIGLYEETSGARLPTFDANGASLGERIVIASIEVR